MIELAMQNVVVLSQVKYLGLCCSYVDFFYLDDLLIFICYRENKLNKFLPDMLVFIRMKFCTISLNFIADLDVPTIMAEAPTRWLRPNEIYAMLSNYKYFTIHVKPMNLPKGNYIFLLLVVILFSVRFCSIIFQFIPFLCP